MWVNHMSIVYYFSKTSETNNFFKYGIKLSQNYDKEININGYLSKCLCAFLNPKDDMIKFESSDYHCLKLDIEDSYAKIIDSFLLDDSSLGPKTIDLNKYIFGTYKNPEVLITTSVLPEKISLLNRDIDVPIMFDNSRDLYYQKKSAQMLEELTSKELYNLLRAYIYDRDS